MLKIKYSDVFPGERNMTLFKILILLSKYQMSVKEKSRKRNRLVN